MTQSIVHLNIAQIIFLSYLLIFGAASLTSLAGAYRARQIPDQDTRYGLMALLLLSGLWAMAQVGYLSVPGSSMKIAIYLVGLIAGFATVGAWLYFCFSYAGRSLHRNRTVQWVALALFAGIVILKLTNPVHHFYFSTGWDTTPFSHLAIHNHALHWITFGLAYALSAIGIFVVMELFSAVASGTGPLLVLVGLTSLPALFNAAGHASTTFLDMGHEPIGVAAFAIGILFVYTDEFQDVQITGNQEAPALVLESQGQIRTYNAPAARLFPSLRQGDSTGKPLAEVVPELARVRQNPQSLLEKTVDSTEKSFLVCESGLGTVHRRPGRLLLLNDVTHQKERERALRDAKEKAEEASQLKSAILANMKHEVRTPLTSVLSFASILKQNVSGQNARYVDLIIRGGERLQDTFDSVLRLSELETGTVDLEAEPIDLAKVVDNTAELIRPQAEEENLDLTTTFPDGAVQGEWDKDALFHVTENLLENAIKFTPDGGSIHVCVQENDTHSILEVEDTGIGIPEEDRSSIFQAFRQIDQGPKREYMGSGLGLSIVKKLIDAHDGQIDLESTPDEGSRFTVHLPKTSPPEADTKPPA